MVTAVLQQADAFRYVNKLLCFVLVRSVCHSHCALYVCLSFLMGFSCVLSLPHVPPVKYWKENHSC